VSRRDKINATAGGAPGWSADGTNIDGLLSDIFSEDCDMAFDFKAVCMKWLTTGVAAVAISFTGCSKAPEADTGAGGKKTIVIGMVAKSQSNDVFQAAYAGAKDAAQQLGAKYNANVTIDWRTPVDEDAAKQVEAIEALTRANVQAILLSCSNADTLTPAIDAAVAKGVPVMCFDSDAPKSKRFAVYGTDDADCGRVIMAELAAAMNNKGTVAILGGNQSAPNLQNRVAGAKAELAKHPEMKLLESGGGVFYHEETPEKSAEAVANATRANGQIQGWCFIGGWPLFTTDALRWPAGSIKVASCDALPAQLGYLKSGHVSSLMAQDCYGWGSKSVEIILEKVVAGKDPSTAKIVDPLTKVTKENADEYGKSWEKWLKK
jgi:ribose transport system substrate-binding protein